MKTSALKSWDLHFRQPEPTAWEFSAERVLAAIRRPIREHPIKFFVLTAWTAFFLGLVARG